MQKPYWFIFFIFSILQISLLHSQETATYGIHQDYISTRAMGMGNAFTAIADDYSALFYNPAALAEREEGNFNLNVANISTTTGESSFLDLYDDIDVASNKQPKSEANNEMARLIESKYGKRYHARASTLSALYAGKGIGWAFIPVDLTLNMDVHQQIGPTLNVVAYLDSTVAFAYARKIGAIEGLSVGGTAKVVHRGYFGKSIPAVELVANSNFVKASDAKEGATLDFDLGTLYHLPVTLPLNTKASAAFVVRNVLDYGFAKNFHFIDANSGKPVPLERRFDVGTVLNFPKFLLFHPTFSADIRDMGHPNWRFRKGYHVGTELALFIHQYLRASIALGINQGYGTAGITFQGLFFRLEATTYGEEVGTAGLPKENRITMAKFSLDF